jgi:hypothetical protein
LVVTALAIAVALGKTAAADPAELDIGWVNVGAASNEALMFAENMVEKPPTQR